MKIKNSFKIIGAVFLTLSLAACGSSSSSSSTPKLGVTGVGKVGVTAIPNANATQKPTFAKVILDESMQFLFGTNIANATHTTCLSNPVITAAIPGGEIEIDEAIVILAQMEADLQGDSSNDVKAGPFALDLLDNNIDAGETITMNLPAGNYEKLKTDFKRIDDNDTTPPSIPAAITTKLLDTQNKRRPSVWIRGAIDQGGTCTNFTFVTDHRWKLTIPFVKSFSESGNGVDLVVLFRIVDALKDALDANSKTAADLAAEVGQGTPDNMGPVFLDGRTKDPDHGTPLAEAWAGQIPLNTDVYAQNSGKTAINDTTPDDIGGTGGTMLDDSANRISGDDNPSASDLDENVT